MVNKKNKRGISRIVQIKHPLNKRSSYDIYWVNNKEIDNRRTELNGNYDYDDGRRDLDEILTEEPIMGGSGVLIGDRPVTRINKLLHRPMTAKHREEITKMWLMGRPMHEIEAVIKTYSLDSDADPVMLRNKKKLKVKIKVKKCSCKKK